MISDIRVGRLMASAAVRGAIENVAINLESITDAAFASRSASEADVPGVARRRTRGAAQGHCRLEGTKLKEMTMKQPIHRALGSFWRARCCSPCLLRNSTRSCGGVAEHASSACFPKDVGEFAYADLKSARKFSWFPQLREQLLPSRFRDFEQFLASAGVDPNTQVEELAWAGITIAKTGRRGYRRRSAGRVRSLFRRRRFQAAEAADHRRARLPSVSLRQRQWRRTTFCSLHRLEHGRLRPPPRAGKTDRCAHGHRGKLLTNDKLFPLINEANGTG